MLFKKIENFHDTVIQMTFACVVSLHPSGNILEFHSYLDKIPPKTGRSFIGKPWFDIFVPEKKGKFSKNYFKTGDFPRNGAHQTPKILTSYANELFVEWNFLRVEESDDARAGILGVGIDVTRHVELEQQLQHADRLAKVGQLAAGVAHELNGPLNNILGYAQLSSKQQDLPEQVYQDLDNIIRFSLHAREIVKKVMLFSRQLPPGHENIDLNKVIKESLYFTEPLCRQKKIDIKCDFEENLPKMKGDFSQLRQVVVNLVVNGAQAMPDKGGKITLQTLTDSKNRIEMIISDTGTGMSPETIEHCFMPFFTTKDVDQGTGLGLSVVHGIIKSHNGVITAHSTLGKGSRFHVTFPAGQEKGETNA
jgi:signal transduction histidine kinase